jgi:hypothetical protein
MIEFHIIKFSVSKKFLSKKTLIKKLTDREFTNLYEFTNLRSIFIRIFVQICTFAVTQVRPINIFRQISKHI